LLAGLQRQEAATGSLETSREVVTTRTDGRIKLYLTYKALNFRREKRAVFEAGHYLPLTGESRRQEHVCAFARALADCSFLVVPRLGCRLLENADDLPLGRAVWGETCLLLPPEARPGRYRNLFTGEVLHCVHEEGCRTLALAEIFATFPVALLERLDSET
jgi:(1->4)-alpha-D-glucan 1-alpha-D-glucosylmutase